jgi:pSer/pThr/pTyr-binding forkhead associated (FHA) protein
MAQDVLALKLTGIAGFCKDRELLIEQGGEAVLGRSRDCALRLTARVPDEPAPARPYKGDAGKQEHLLTVSGRHARIRFAAADDIEIEDLSKHGTFVNGRRVEGKDSIQELHKGPMELRLGTNETFRMELTHTPTRAKPRIVVKRPGDDS